MKKSVCQFASRWSMIRKVMRFVTLFILFSFAFFIVSIMRVNAESGSFEAEDFVARKGNDDALRIESNGLEETDVDGNTYTISNASGGAFIITPNGVDGSGTWVKYEFTVKGGNYYWWARAIAPSVSDNSVFWAFDITDAEADANQEGTVTNIFDFFEKEELRKFYTTDWFVYPLTSRNGPWPGRELDQYPAELPETIDELIPTPTATVDLSAGKHTLHIIYREDGTSIDKFYYSTEPTHPTSVQPTGKLTATWAQIKQTP
ncbi:MAG: hypothetical protein ACE5PV_09225 [Candidatus Poribacteria bacterium]